jgi:NTP pyrophosphatase (non-canonical NTP hydrolase)
MSIMNANEYQQEALRTESHNYNIDVNPRLLQGLMGLCGESGEALDVFKKHVFHEHWLDREHLARELGDVAWYLAISADALGYTLDEIFAMNVDKLRKRYPEGFDSDKSIHRSAGDN